MAKRHPCKRVGLDFVESAPYRFVSTVDLAITPEQLFEVLADSTKLPLSPTRMPRDVEDRLCYICVPPVEVSLNKSWGTRTHTVVLVRADGSVTAVERSRLPGESDVREEFSLT